MNAAENSLSQPAAEPGHWWLDPKVVFLNHGSFGACPRHVLECQNEWRARLERQPLQFLVRELEPELERARKTLGELVGAAADDLAFLPNATAGVNTVLRSLKFKCGDELLVTDHEYNASRNALDFVAEASGARVVVARLPFPFRRADDLLAPLLERVNGRTRLILIDHITSQTGVVLPLAGLVKGLGGRDIDILVDGAHGPGMVPLNLDQLGVAYYTGNCHKWLCAPKGAAFLHVRRDKQGSIRPLAISHGANSARQDRSRFQLEFGWQGTSDPSAALGVADAIRFIGSLMPGQWPEIMARNRALALAAREVLCGALEVEAPCPADFIGALASVPLPAAEENELARLPFNEYPLQDRLREQHGIEVPIISWPAAPHRLLRISAHLYNSLPQYQQLGEAVTLELRRKGKG